MFGNSRKVENKGARTRHCTRCQRDGCEPVNAAQRRRMTVVAQLFVPRADAGLHLGRHGIVSSMKTDRTCVTVAVVVATLTACLLWPSTAYAELSGVATEHALAQMALRQAWNECPPDSDADRQRMVRSVGERVLSQWPTPLKGYNYRFYVDSCRHRNAWALPAGHISVSRGLLDALETEDQLAAVLAHEIAHVEHRHGYRKWRNYRNRALIRAALVGFASATENAFDDLAAITYNIVTQLNLFAHSRDREREADLAASMYLHRAGLGDGPMRQMFRKLGGGGGGMLSTHPHLAERIARAGTTETQAFADTDVFHGFNRRGDRVATLRFDLQRRFGSELSVVATLTATDQLGESDNINTIKIHSGGRRVTLNEMTAEQIHPGRRVSAIFRSDSARSLIKDPIERVDMNLRNVEDWVRAYTASGDPTEIRFDDTVFEGVDRDGERVATLSFVTQRMLSDGLQIVVRFKAGAAMRGSDRIRDLTVLSGGRELRLSTRVSDRVSVARPTRMSYRVKGARAFINAPIESVKLKLQRVERWQRVVGASERVDRPGNAAPEPTCWVSFGCEGESRSEPGGRRQRVRASARVDQPGHTSSATSRQKDSRVLNGLAADAATSQRRGSTGGVGAGERTRNGSGTGGGLRPDEGVVYRSGAGIVNPRLLREVRPQYTAEALRAKITGTVHLEMVVLPDGTVGDVRITRSLDPVFGLDEEAIKAARQWLFEPGTRFGEPVAMLLNLALDFNLRQRR